MSTLNVLRMSPDGTSTKIQLKQVSSTGPNGISSFLLLGTGVGTGCTFLDNPVSNPLSRLVAITNADQGVLVASAPPVCGNANLLNQSFDGTLLSYVGADGSVSVLAPDSLSQASPLTPVLQREDGSYIGESGGDIWTINQDGSQIWTFSAPQAFSKPLYATEDGGVIVRSTTSGSNIPPTLYTLNQNGNVTAQASDTNPAYSWKGAYTVTGDPMINLLDDSTRPLLAASFAAVTGGNLTGNGFSLRHKTFGIIFCGTAGPQNDGPCPVEGPNSHIVPDVAPMIFGYIPGVQTEPDNYKQACDVTVTLPCNNNTPHPEWGKAMKDAAITAYEAAFANLPAIVYHNVKTEKLNAGFNQSIRFFDHVHLCGW